MIESRIVSFVFFAVLLIGLAMAAMAIRTSRRLWRAVESRHPDTWHALGEPRTGRMVPARGRLLKRFVRQRGHLSLNDSEITALAGRLARLSYAMDGAFWVGVALVLWMALTRTG